MAESVAAPNPVSPNRNHWAWIPGVLFRPRRTFTQIASAGRVWLMPLLVLSVTTLARVLVEGYLRQLQAQAGGLPLPPDFQYYPPDMQARYMQSIQATQSPVFFYVFPAILALGGIWIGWLLVSGVLHLALTLLGGRGDTATASNMVAWASLPFALRDLVRLLAEFSTRSLINAPGLSGFLPADSGNGIAYLSAFLSLIDVYLIWHAVLLVFGARAANSLTPAKTVLGVLLTLLLVLAVQALLGFLGGLFSDMTVIRPFF